MDLPHKQGLYDPANEHDACGVGFIAHIKGEKRHDIILQGLEILKNLDHRGAVGADPLQGDGAGILIQIPDQLYREEMAAQGVTLPLPGSTESEYLLILPFSPANKPNMIAWMAARNDPGHYGELVVYQMDRQSLVFGPIQVEGRIDQEPTISQQFTLWDQRGSSVVRGNLLVLPIHRSFLYVEPVYLLSEANALPELRRIVTASNTGVAMGETLQRALVNLSQSDLSQTTGVTPTTPDTPTGDATPAPAPTPAAAPVTLDELVAAANAHLQAAEQAQRDGDWARYGQELAALRENLAALAALTGQ